MPYLDEKTYRTILDDDDNESECSYSVFRAEFLNAKTWAQRKDGVPLELLDGLSEEELSAAEEELISAAGLNDDWPIIGLGHIGSKKALPILYELLENAKNGQKIVIAHSIFQINNDEKMCEIVLDELALAAQWSKHSIIDIIYLLKDFQNAEITQKLNEFYDSEKYLVAYNAARALGLPTEPIVEKFRGRKNADDKK